MKICSRCHIRKSACSFPRNASRSDGRSRYCTPCQRDYIRSHYRRNKQQYLYRNQERRVNLKALINKLKAGPCSDCHRSYPPYVMDFDHVRGHKLRVIGRAAHSGVSYTTLLDEIAKCELVCSNCHRERTHVRLVNRTTTSRLKDQN